MRDIEARANQDSLLEARHLMRTLTTHVEEQDPNSGKLISLVSFFSSPLVTTDSQLTPTPSRHFDTEYHQFTFADSFWQPIQPKHIARPAGSLLWIVLNGLQIHLQHLGLFKCQSTSLLGGRYPQRSMFALLEIATLLKQDQGSATTQACSGLVPLRKPLEREYNPSTTTLAQLGPSSKCFHWMHSNLSCSSCIAPFVSNSRL